MEIEILGSGQEVGKSGILIKEGKSSVVLDYGPKIFPLPPTYPAACKPNAAIITHAHLDHSGAAPMLLRNRSIPLFMTDVTLDLSLMLIRDSLKIAQQEQYPIPFGNREIRKMVRCASPMKRGVPFQADVFRCKFYDAGHIPGSVGVLIQGGKKIFYTGDVQTEHSRLLSGCTIPEPVDTLIIESTYGTKFHTNRRQEEKRFLDAVEETLANGGNAIIPVFAVGRAQELLMVLERYAKKIAIDGMVRTATEIILDYPRSIREHKKLASIVQKTHIVKRGAERKDIYKKYPIILSSAGMLTGGPIRYYAAEASGHTKNKILFTGYLVEETAGKKLMETKKLEHLEEIMHVHCDVQQFDFSAHADQRGLFDIIRKTKPKQVVCVHGDACDRFADVIRKELGVHAYAPTNGERIRV
ncbi:MAG: MBL fold metallo-hydrolase [Candidatus Aenigmarchaeota archaeon]|nr:MBL fold metallo-hydrolase [Candidatus Aenigmarchaeota archaeon]